ncbi:hypothetical protein DERP_000328 [Dermatophagoides pteronyssinus]|uniref:Uncharacterized protein n=1 Tax=Dermatophagoides pteronyssinus TaxID=6956 RepID=A0ABQ8IZX6_DERPT|nr:hypothetical protein DERP_000328 [Dermatophagoides pteronyssinus]
MSIVYKWQHHGVGIDGDNDGGGVANRDCQAKKEKDSPAACHTTNHCVYLLRTEGTPCYNSIPMILCFYFILFRRTMAKL